MFSFLIMCQFASDFSENTESLECCPISYFVDTLSVWDQPGQCIKSFLKINKSKAMFSYNTLGVLCVLREKWVWHWINFPWCFQQGTVHAAAVPSPQHFDKEPLLLVAHWFLPPRAFSWYIRKFHGTLVRAAALTKVGLGPRHSSAP